MKLVALHNLGCKVNAYDMEVMERKLVENDFRVVPFDQKADIYIINTCSVTNIADRKSRQMLHRARSLNPSAIIVAAGCYVNTRGSEEILADNVDIAITNENKKNIAAILTQYLKIHNLDDTIDESYVPSNDSPVNSHTRAYLKVQDGCNQFCSYCIIPYARGRIKSRTIRDIHSEVEHLTAEGFREFVLTGIHLSSFGLDRPEDDESLISLIEDLALIDNVHRIRLGSLEPRIITTDFVSRLSIINAICPQFHLSLQSGSDSVLKRMNRHYTTADYMDGVKLLRRYFNNPAITTDIITGFPGETEEEFAETVDFVRRVNFYETHIFKYSRRTGTAADKMDDQLTDAVKSSRSDILLSMTAANKAAYADSFIGGPAVEVLFEDELELDGRRFLSGYTKEYVRAAVPGDFAVSGTVLSGHITSRINGDIMAFSPSL